MPQRRRLLRLAIPCWETGRIDSGFGVKVGGLGAVMEELPEELVRAAARLGFALEVEILTPCFGHYDRGRLERSALTVPVTLDAHTFAFEVFRRRLDANLSMVYFWDETQLSWTHGRAIYPDDPEMALKLFSSVSQAMAGYITQGRFHTVHLQDFHVALIPFYLGDDFLREVPHHFTIHNASYQGAYRVAGRGYESLYRINLPGERLFHKYFDFFDHLNLMKGAMIKVHETGGKVTTVSGDLDGTWGYAAELRENHAGLLRKARAQKPWAPVGEVFVPNRYLDVFEHIPVAGITNGLSERNWPRNLPELKAAHLRAVQKRLPSGETLFRHPKVQGEMLRRDHSFDTERLDVKLELKRLLHLEAFGEEPNDGCILLTAVGRLVEQKNFGLVADLVERILGYDPGLKLAILASAPDGDGEGKRTEAAFLRLSREHPSRFFFSRDFNPPLAKLILASGDFSLIPSRFEPCGLVDYEASLLGNVVIGHKIGGLAKVEHCAYLYEWLDLADRAGEAEAFFSRICAAVDTYRQRPEQHRELVRSAMAVDAGWARSAERYIRPYHHGLLLREWDGVRAGLLGVVDTFAGRLVEKEPLFERLFFPFRGDLLDQRLARALKSPRVEVGAGPESSASRRGARPKSREGPPTPRSRGGPANRGR
jgi:glycogen synthase